MFNNTNQPVCCHRRVSYLPTYCHQCIKIMFNYDRLITNMKVMDWEHADYGIIKRIVYKDKVVGECQVNIKIKNNSSVISKLLFSGNVL